MKVRVNLTQEQINEIHSLLCGREISKEMVEDRVNTFIIATRLRKIRLERNASMADVTAKTSITSSALDHVEAHRRKPSSAMLVSLTGFYGITIEELMREAMPEEIENVILFFRDEKQRKELLDKEVMEKEKSFDEE
ncbi:helix-turn-helix domain-containing protein [Brevibacillus sp. NPDC058079]|uniref:helix-turn-helix domain-containing protein n=1 Tax=Brevibacillus sp. NPDC058079 TaxID=3346330 RepID=UPI0036EE021F